MLFWLVSFILIGLVVGWLGNNWMPGQIARRNLFMGFLGAIGALAGGGALLQLFQAGQNSAALYGYNMEGSTLPAFWLSLIGALVGALIIVAVYKLVTYGEE